MDLLKYFSGKKVYGIFDSDLDGVGSRLIAEYYIKPICDIFVPLNTGDRSMEDFNYVGASKCDIIIFVDITPKDLEMWEKLTREMNKEVFIFDHHLTGKEQLGELPNYYFSQEECGCSLFFNSLLEGKRKLNIIKEFVYFVNIYDLYLTDHIDWIKAKNLFGTMFGYVDWSQKDQPDTEKYEKFLEIQFKKFEWFPDSNFYFTHYEKELIAKADKKEMANYKLARKNMQRRIDNSGNSYIYTECGAKLSLVANRLLLEFKDSVDYIIIHSTFLENYRNELNGKLSLRSLGNFDVKIIAEKYDGGGHPQAAGVEISIETFNLLRRGEIHLI